MRFEDGFVSHFVAPTPEEKAVLLGWGIDPHTLQCALDPDEPARAECLPAHLAFILKHPRSVRRPGKLAFEVASVGLFLFPDRLAAVSEELPALRGKLLPAAGSPRETFLRLLLASSGHFQSHLRVIDMAVDEIEEKISRSMENRWLLNLFSLQKSLVIYLSAIDSNQAAFSHLRQHAERTRLSAEELATLDDILIENGQCAHQAEIHAGVLANLMDARVSIVNNNLSRLMKTLNLITILIMVPTLVVSVFSMNVPLPLQGRPAAFWGVLALAAASLAGVLAWWRWFSGQLGAEKD